MLAEVIAFAIVMSLFEFIIICMIPIRTRLRVLGSEVSKMSFHIGMLVANLWVHWGTVVGTMSSTLSFITSMGVIWMSVRLFGHIKENRYYTIGILKYAREELR
jgi:hypothetical protein